MSGKHCLFTLFIHFCKKKFFFYLVVETFECLANTYKSKALNIQCTVDGSSSSVIEILDNCSVNSTIPSGCQICFVHICFVPFNFIFIMASSSMSPRSVSPSSQGSRYFSCPHFFLDIMFLTFLIFPDVNLSFIIQG